MIEFYVVRRAAHLEMATAHDAAQILRLPPNRILSVQASPKAPLKLSRWYRGMVALLVEATGRWPNQEIAHKEFMYLAGMVDSIVIKPDGTARMTPMSTTEWDIIWWRDYLDRIMPIIVERFVGETRAAFRDRVDRYIGIKMKEAWEEAA